MPAQITIKANLQDVAGGSIERGSLSFLLCSYFNGMPTVPAAALLGRVVAEDVEADAEGNISVEIWGNDVINPAGTFYTVTLKDDNGDIVQVAAYRFTGAGTIDLSAWPQLDLDAVVPIPPIDFTVHVPYAPVAVFDAMQGDVFEMLLSGDVAPVLANLVPGDIYTFIFLQDATGNHAVNWPAQVINATAANGQGVTIQEFVCTAARQLRAISPATYF